MQVAFVTGGAVRIGAAIVRALSRAGYAVVVHYHRSHKEAEALKQELPHIALVQADLMEISPKDLIEAAGKSFGPLSLLVNNASLFEKDEIGEISAQTLAKHSKIHVEVPLLCAQAFAEQAPEGASIVNMIDQRALRPHPLFFSYTLSKVTQFHMTKMLAQALAPNIRVNAIGPGPTLKNSRQDDKDFNAQVQATPLGEVVSLEEIGAAVLYLARTKSLTGQMLALDSGQHLAWKTPDVWGINE